MEVKPIKFNIYVEMNEDFNTSIKFKDGSELYLDPSWEHYRHVKQNGVVHSISPRVKGVSVGDTVWFHHFVPVTDTIKGDTVSNHDEYLRKKLNKRLYLVDAKDRNKGGAEQLFAYENKETGFHCYGDYVLVKPIVNEIPRTASGIFLESQVKEVVQEGHIVHSNEMLEKNGFVEGDRVKFSKHSEYELEVHGETLWCMRTTDILLKYA